MKKLKLISILSILFICSPTEAKSLSFKKWQTTNGAEVIFHQTQEVPMLDLSIAFAAGSAYDGPSFGLSTLTMGLMDEGNSGLSANEIAKKLADTGAQYQATNNRDMAVFNLKTLTSPDVLKSSTDLISLMLSHPDFPLDAFEREKNQLLMSIKQKEQSPDLVAEKMFYKLLYKTHPYGHPISGETETVSKLSLAEVQNFYKKYFVSRNAIIVMVGAIDENKAHEIAENLTKNLATGEHASSVPLASSLAEEINIEIKFPSSQTVIRLGQLAINHQNPNYFPLIVGNYTLGGGTLVSQLANEVREKRGLTYGVYSQFLPMPGLGPFVISLSTKNSQAQEAITVTRKTLNAFISAGPSDKELEDAKEYLTGSFPLSISSNRSIAELLLRINFYHLPSDYLDTYIDNIRKVTKEQIKSAFQSLVTPNKMLQISVGKV